MRAPRLAALLLVAVAAGCAVATPRPAPPRGDPQVEARLDLGPSVRLAVAPRATEVVVRGASLVATDTEGGRGPVAGRPGAGAFALAAAGPEVALGGRLTGTGRVRVEGAGALEVALDGGPPRVLRGRVEVVARAGSLVVVNEIPMERYLAGVVPLEMDATTWPMEALKAQAVASRTYAMHQREARRRGGAAPLYDLETSVLDQVYGGAAAEDPRGAAAVAATAGEWLAGPDGAPILAAFHSTSGGRTEAAEAVWGSPRPYLVSLLCPYDRESPVYEWRWIVPPAEVEQRLAEAGYAVPGLERLDVRDRTASGRVRTVLAAGEGGAVVVPGTDLRRILGFRHLRSTAFEVTREGDQFRFEGRGSGHGVGMCQWGARGMALAGHDYRQILDYYYPGVRLVSGARAALAPPPGLPGRRPLLSGGRALPGRSE